MLAYGGQHKCYRVRRIADALCAEELRKLSFNENWPFTGLERSEKAFQGEDGSGNEVRDASEEGE